MRIIKENTAAIVVDIQSKLFPSIHEHEILEQNCLKLIAGLKIFNTPIIVTEQYKKGLGDTIPSIQEALKEEYNPVEKMAFSCCESNDVMKFLKDFNKTEVILFGIETHVCVLQTALDLIEFGFKPVIIENCVSSRNPNDKKIALKRLRQDGAIITTLESILFELCQESGTEEFKALLKVVK